MHCRSWHEPYHMPNDGHCITMLKCIGSRPNQRGSVLQMAALSRRTQTAEWAALSQVVVIMTTTMTMLMITINTSKYNVLMTSFNGSPTTTTVLRVISLDDLLHALTLSRTDATQQCTHLFGDNMGTTTHQTLMVWGQSACNAAAAAANLNCPSSLHLLQVGLISPSTTFKVTDAGCNTGLLSSKALKIQLGLLHKWTWRPDHFTETICHHIWPSLTMPLSESRMLPALTSRWIRPRLCR